MLLYNRNEAISVKFKKHIIEEIDIHEDIPLDILEHFSYINDLEEMDIEFMGNGSHISECDYCGKQLTRNWQSRKDNGKGGKLSNTYVDSDAEYPSTDDCCMDCIWKKRRIYNFINYGTIVDLKAMDTRTKNGHVPTSRQQIYLSDLLNAKLNPYYKDIGFIDIVIEDEMIVVEYDGSGHYLGIQFGKYTYEEKIKLDYIRDLSLRELGYKVIRIESKYDYLPTDEVIIKKINEIKNHFNTSEEEFFKWIIPSSKKDLSYGRLRSIIEEDLNR